MCCVVQVLSSVIRCQAYAVVGVVVTLVLESRLTHRLRIVFHHELAGNANHNLNLDQTNYPRA